MIKQRKNGQYFTSYKTIINKQSKRKDTNVPTSFSHLGKSYHAKNRYENHLITTTIMTVNFPYVLQYYVKSTRYTSAENYETTKK